MAVEVLPAVRGATNPQLRCLMARWRQGHSGESPAARVSHSSSIQDCCHGRCCRGVAENEARADSCREERATRAVRRAAGQASTRGELIVIGVMHDGERRRPGPGVSSR